MRAIVSALLFVAAVVSATPGCTRKYLELDVQTAPSWTAGRKRISVFGAFKGGAMSNETWHALAPRLALGKDCEVGWASLRAADGDLYVKLDRTIKEEGLGADVMASVAPRATGDYVLAVVVSGATPPPPKKDEALASPLLGQSMGRGRSRSLERRSSFGGDALEASVVLVSVASKEVVLEVSLRYTGVDAGAALDKLGEKLREALPDAACTGWTWSTAE